MPGLAGVRAEGPLVRDVTAAEVLAQVAVDLAGAELGADGRCKNIGSRFYASSKLKKVALHLNCENRDRFSTCLKFHEENGSLIVH